MYQRQGNSAFKKDLTNIRKLCKAIGNPQKKFTSIHVAGTNGKGSVSHQLGAVLQVEGYKTAMYTSPHYKDFRERIKINGVLISEQEVIDFIHDKDTLIAEIEPSFFEITVAMAFDFFYKNNVDLAIIETGLGGRLDSTNIIKPILSIITNVSFDHQNMLGNTIMNIAKEKAGIIKKNIPLVIGQGDPVYSPVLIKKADQQSASYWIADKIWKIEELGSNLQSQNILIKRKGKKYAGLNIPKKGAYQNLNLVTVLQSIEILRKYCNIKIAKSSIISGFENYPSLTHFIGRWEIKGTKPSIVFDSAHNEGGIKEVMNELKLANFAQVHIVLGFVKDKELTQILAQLPTSGIYYFTQADLPRALACEQLYKQAKDVGLSGKAYKKAKNAYRYAKLAASKKDLILVLGSIFLLAELME